MCGRTTSVVDFSGTSSVGSGRLDSVQSCGTTVIHCRKNRLIFRDKPRSVDDLKLNRGEFSDVNCSQYISEHSEVLLMLYKQ
jgi:hypothetical protein